ncbi:hypothetical protein HDV05_002052, partial [Chytridiales sp. JEL 0842]
MYLNKSKQSLDATDFPHLPPSTSTSLNSHTLDPFRTSLASPSSSSAPPSPLPSLLRAYGPLWSLGFLLKLTESTLALLIPLVLQQLIYWTENKRTDRQFWVSSGWGLAALLVGMAWTRVVLFSVAYSIVYAILPVNVRTAITDGLVQKAMRLSPAAGREFNAGKIFQLINVDANMIPGFISYSDAFPILILQILVSLFLLSFLLGPIPVLSGAAALLLTLGVITLLGRHLKSSYSGIVSAGDKRLHHLRETLLSIKQIKTHALEPIFSSHISSSRSTQIKHLRIYNYLNALLMCLTQITPLLMPLISFLVYAVRNQGVLEGGVVFPSLVLFGQMKAPMDLLNFVFGMFVGARGSWKRVKEYLVAEERSGGGDASSTGLQAGEEKKEEGAEKEEGV